MLLVSAMSPILAFAASGFKNISTPQNCVVTGSIYVDDETYGAYKLEDGTIAISVYGDNAKVIDVVYATYRTYDNDFGGIFDFDTTEVTRAAYSTYYNLQFADGAVSYDVYKQGTGTCTSDEDSQENQLTGSGFLNVTAAGRTVTGSIYVDQATYSIYNVSNKGIAINVYAANSNVAQTIYATFETYDTGHRRVFSFNATDVTYSTYYVLQFADGAISYRVDNTGTDPSNQDPGTPDPGTPDPGTQDPGTPDPGTQDPGTQDPGTPPGTQDPGTPDPGTQDPGTQDPGTQDPGTQDPGTQDPGTQDPGTQDPGTPDPGTQNPDNGIPGFPIVIAPPASGNNNQVVDRNQLTSVLEAGSNAVLKISGNSVDLPADVLVNGKSLTISNEAGVSVTLPLSTMNLAALAKSMGIDLKDLVIRVEMKQLEGSAAAAVSEAVKATGANQLAEAYDFKVTAVGGGKEIAIEKFGQFVSRTIPMTGSSTNAIGVMFNPTTKELSFVPSTFGSENGKTIATLKRNGMSIYTVIQSKSTRFNDALPFWSKDAIESLSAKMILEGTGKNQFEPNRSITRAEFAALVIRSLGVQPAASSTTAFNDVLSTKWYAGTVAAAAEIGLIIGDEKGNFNPNAPITRKEVAAIVARAAEYAGKSIKLTDAEANAALVGFKDTAALGWAKAEVASAIKAGIVNGQSTNTIAGNASANRAEAATMIARYLPIAGLSN
ncbi:S-layer homology domain-containing protein [Paenibacillus sp. D51F]